VINPDEYKTLARGREHRTGKPKLAAHNETDRTIIWFQEHTDKKRFSAVFQAVRMARIMVEKSVLKLTTERNDRLTQLVLNYHFGGEREKEGKVSESELDEITQRFQTITVGLTGEVIICVSKKMVKPHDRGLTTYKGNTTRRKMLTMCINLEEMEGDLPQSVAATIIHEASHKYCGARGEDELYAFDDDYLNQSTGQTIDRPDSYAYAALSFHEGHLITYHNWSNPGGFQADNK
jgi:hypothetical protein